MNCGYPVVRRTGGREGDAVTFCDKPARWYHAEGCGSKYRCTRHTYPVATGRACMCCGNQVEQVREQEKDDDQRAETGGR